MLLEIIIQILSYLTALLPLLVNLFLSKLSYERYVNRLQGEY